MANNPQHTVDELTADLSLLDISTLVKRPQNPIAYGTSSSVFMSQFSPAPQQFVPVAIKKIGNEVMERQEVEQRTKREIAVWRSLKHPNITELLGIVYLQQGMPPCTVSLLQQCHLLAYIDGHPRSRLRKIREIAVGVEYLHSREIVHGDLTLDNILISDNGTAQVNDFDMSRIMNIEGFSAMTWRDARFNAPELMIPSQYSSVLPTFESDVFGLGILFLQIFHGSDNNPDGLPYNHISGDSYSPGFLLRIRSGERPIRERYRPMSNEHWELLRRCWLGNPSERPNITEVVNSL